MGKSDRWFCAEGEMDGLPTLIRGRQGLSKLVEAHQFPHLLRIQWNYDDVGVAGLPSDTVSSSMNAFENLVIPGLEQDSLCIFFCVFTHNGLREWLAYTRDIQATCDAINALLAKEVAFPIEMGVEDDPDWSEYHELMENTSMDEDG